MPAWGNFLLDKGMDAGGALVKFRAVKMSAEETIVAVTAITDEVVGVEQFGVTAAEITKGKGASVRMAGVTEMECSAACAVGDTIGIAADGRCKPAAVGDRIIGRCLKGTAAAGERAAVQLSLPGIIATTGSV